MDNHAHGKLKHAELLIVVTRADGTVEDHGVVAEYHEPKPLLRRIWNAISGGK